MAHVPVDTEICRAFKKWMDRMELSDIDAAVALGCHRNTIRRYREGTAPIPRYILLACAAVALGVSEIQEYRKFKP